MSKYTEFFLNSPSNVVQLELIEISHSAFSKIYRIVRNNTSGVTVKLETGSYATFDYYPLKITPISQQDDLDQILKIELGDLGEIIPVELDAVHAANKYNEKPVLIYRTYRSDDLEEILFGPINLEVKSFAFTKNGAAFEAIAPSLNINKTGEFYTIDRFPTLKGFL